MSRDLRSLEKAVEHLRKGREWLEDVGRNSGVLTPEDRDRMAASVKVIEDVCRGRLDELALELEGEPIPCACGRPSVGDDDGANVCAVCYLNRSPVHANQP